MVSWISTAYFLTKTVATLPVGQILTLYSTKRVYVSGILIFELGSLLCAVSTSMPFLIVGRLIAGIGATTVNVAAIWLIAQIARLEIRPILFGMIALMETIACTIGPIIGGAFSEKVTWRWCFYVNLPIGGLALAISYFMPGENAPKKASSDKTLAAKFLEIDWIGCLISSGMIIAFLFPLQLGGNTYPWKSASVITPLILSAVGIASFLAWQRIKGARAILPWSILRKSILGSSFVSFWTYWALFDQIYYIPLWYQVQGRTALQSGIDTLPFLLSSCLAPVFAGLFSKKTGYYWPIMVIFPLLSSIGTGLMYTMGPASSRTRMIGYQIISGIGTGATLQLPDVSIQAELAHESQLIPQATGLMALVQGIGALIGLAISAAVFLNQLTIDLRATAPFLSETVAKELQQSIAYIFTLPASEQDLVVQAYIKSLNLVFIAQVPAGVLASLTSLTMIRNYNLKHRGRGAGSADERMDA
ncbi:MFS general substrate transporter [Coniophora puteana RWD-64-598 SS2]|uniref:MFS general substrate transporter n=1 Tax=Coniophora puteana (strain RWD-64-598) TaxID=741705 RepID=A0A5M3MJG1_CONPW|nr:MFS general substrate transporter [Coniophora puteana RWD-64-598 SS2]EIW78934.1 MFS general substrate transporter [Coniophora puteana RWD-64-598 SS2]